MFKSLSLILVAFFVQGAFSLVEFEGQCPTPTGLKNVDWNAFGGKWIALLGGFVELPNGETYIPDRSCVTGDWTFKSGNAVSISGSAIATATNSEVTRQWEGTTSKDGLVSLKPTVPATYGSVLLLDTDYKNWASLWTCVNTSDKTYNMIGWAVSRKTTMSEEDEVKALLAFKNIDVPLQYFYRYHAENCSNL